ncbi:Capsule polysaccharide transporter [Comamonas aquatilis]
MFYPTGAQSFKGAIEDWLPELKRFVLAQAIDAVLLFGDCRPVHAGVRKLGQQMGFAVGVFEEGYLRPDHVTFEPIGVNGHSQFHTTLESWLSSVVAASVSSSGNEDHGDCIKTVSGHQPVGRSYWHGAMWGMLYFFAAWLAQWFWNNSLHHRKMSIVDAPWWWLSYGRKAWYCIAERGVEQRLTDEKHDQFFLVPLQVHNDAQITVHSDYESVCSFIDHVMSSFAAALRRSTAGTDSAFNVLASLADDLLVFKHHPMDRGHRDYSKVIRLLTKRYGLEERVLYIHDQHLPSLLKAAKGVVLVNSTTGLSALGHDAPVKVCGSALYDMPGLTYQGSLRDFWFAAPSAKPDKDVLRRFKKALLERTQLNGNFYKKLSICQWRCGVMLQGQMAQRLWPEHNVLSQQIIRKHLPEPLAQEVNTGQ